MMDTEQMPQDNLKISRGEKPDNDIDFDLIEDVPIYDENGDTIKFGDLYRTQKTIIILIRVLTLSFQFAVQNNLE